jgi:hypothetical protein
MRPPVHPPSVLTGLATELMALLLGLSTMLKFLTMPEVATGQCRQMFLKSPPYWLAAEAAEAVAQALTRTGSSRQVLAALAAVEPAVVFMLVPARLPRDPL